MTEWWHSLETLEQVYWIVALIASCLFLFVIVMTFVGGLDADADLGEFDTDMEADHGIGFQFFTFKNTVGFFTLFAWSGLASIHSGNENWVTILISTVCGFVMMFLMALLFRAISKMAESGTLNIQNAVGQIGEVYLNIEANRKKMGKIHIKVQGSLRELDAITDEDEDLVHGNVVKVTEIVSEELLLVEKLK